jgi:ribonuclease T2
VQAEGEWAQSEVGEGVEEVWERSVSLEILDDSRSAELGQWNTAGRFISTLGDACRGGRATGAEVRYPY